MGSDLEDRVEDVCKNERAFALKNLSEVTDFPIDRDPGSAWGCREIFETQEVERWKDSEGFFLEVKFLVFFGYVGSVESSEDLVDFFRDRERESFRGEVIEFDIQRLEFGSTGLEIGQIVEEDQKVGEDLKTKLEKFLADRLGRHEVEGLAKNEGKFDQGFGEPLEVSGLRAGEN